MSLIAYNFADRNSSLQGEQLCIHNFALECMKCKHIFKDT
jgi:hypothetical protein